MTKAYYHLYVKCGTHFSDSADSIANDPQNSVELSKIGAAFEKQ